jgi:hypothetical protein
LFTRVDHLVSHGYWRWNRATISPQTLSHSAEGCYPGQLGNFRLWKLSHRPSLAFHCLSAEATRGQRATSVPEGLLTEAKTPSFQERDRSAIWVR